MWSLTTFFYTSKRNVSLDPHPWFLPVPSIWSAPEVHSVLGFMPENQRCITQKKPHVVLADQHA